MTPAEIERLALLAEEMGEALQMIGKTLRHGKESCHPDGGESNIENLQKELGDVQFSIQLMQENDDISFATINHYANEKRKRVSQYLHHNDVFPLDRCGNACGFQSPYGFVPETDCPVHDA